MPYIVENGETRFVTQAELDAYNKANPVGQSPDALFEELRQRNQAGTVPAGGNIVNVVPTNSNQTPEQILVPNTSNTSPNQELPQSFESYSDAEDIPVESRDGFLTDLNTGETYAVDENGFTEIDGLNILPEDIPNQEAEDQELVPLPDPVDPTRARDPGSYTPEELDAIARANGVDAGDVDPEVGIPDAQLFEQEGRVSALRDQARQQQTLAQQRRQINNGDWRVRLRLAPQSKYLYNSPTPGIMQPLQVTDGVLFPYTPTINTVYRANYNQYDLTHSNYRGYFYQNSAVDAITLTAMFTAQDTSEANYLLAVITFLKSATKMFYGQDAERGAPPPMVYLTGLGEYQFNEHPCLIQSFTYNLPGDVDYIRAGTANNVGVNLISRRDRQSVSTNSVFGSLNRLANAFLTKGALPNVPSPPSLGLNRPTYVPTKLEISLTLLPTQSRQQVSKQFSVKEFANGNLIKGGFW